MREDLAGYLELGWNIIPIAPKTKKPLIEWKQYQTERVTAEQVIAWSAAFPECSWAVITGAISGIVVVDVDSKDPKHQFDGHNGPICNTPHGVHYYFRHPGYPVQNGVRIRDRTDVRGDGGYVLLPPSPGYSWEGSFERRVDGGLDIYDPPKKYVQALEGPPPGERNVSLTSLAGALLRGLDERLWDSQLYVLQAANRNSEEPLPESEVHTIFASISKRERERRAGRKLDRAIAVESSDVATAEDFPAQRWLVPHLVAEGGIMVMYGKPKKGKSILASQIALSVAGEQPLFGSRKPRDITEGVVPDAEGSEVAIFSLEEKRSTLARRLLRQLGRPTTRGRIHISNPGPVSLVGLISAVRELASQHPRLRLVVVDPLVNVREDDHERNPYVREYNKIQAFRELSDELGLAFLIIHHARKAEAEEVTDANLGTSGTPGAADINILFRRRKQEPYAQLEVESRLGDDYETMLEWNKPQLRWENLGPGKIAKGKIDEERMEEFIEQRGSNRFRAAELADHLEISQQAASSLLRRLGDAIERFEDGHRTEYVYTGTTAVEGEL